ncbi:MAG: hypothetical protein CME33_01880 [Gimesia sp.]|nr:hypothetical protein [Gimesia sp.]
MLGGTTPPIKTLVTIKHHLNLKFWTTSAKNTCTHTSLDSTLQLHQSKKTLTVEETPLQK